MMENKRLYSLINPSDPYTFYAPSVEVAAASVALLSPGFGAQTCDGQEPKECTPVLFGWDEWMEDRGINGEWVNEHKGEIADALDSFLIGDESSRRDVESMLSMIPEDKQQEWRDGRQDRNRTSMNMIGEYAYDLAKRLRKAGS